MREPGINGARPGPATSDQEQNLAGPAPRA